MTAQTQIEAHENYRWKRSNYWNLQQKGSNNFNRHKRAETIYWREKEENLPHCNKMMSSLSSCLVYINGKIKGANVFILLHIGSSHTKINQSLWKKIKINTQKLSKQKINLKSVKHEKIGVMGETEIMLCLLAMNKIKKIRFKTKVVVIKGIAQSIIIRLDFLEQYGANIQLIKKSVTFPNKEKILIIKCIMGKEWNLLVTR